MKQRSSDISNYTKNIDWLYIIASVVLCDALFIVFFRKQGKNINRWYSSFGILSVIADIVIIIIAIFIARFVYTACKLKWNPVYFVGVCLLVQIIHDIFYYFAVVLPLPQGTNGMIDFMKIYGKEGGLWPIIGDSMLVCVMVCFAMLLATLPDYVSVITLLFGIYVIPYALTSTY